MTDRHRVRDTDRQWRHSTTSTSVSIGENDHDSVHVHVPHSIATRTSAVMSTLLFKPTHLNRYRSFRLVQVVCVVALLASSYQLLSELRRSELIWPEYQSRQMKADADALDTSEKLRPIIKMADNSSLEFPKLFELNTHYGERFDRLMQAECAVRLLNATGPCIETLRRLDDEMREDRRRQVANYDECNECMKADGSEHTRPIIYHHTFWHQVKQNAMHVRVMKLNIMSYLATQNMCCTKFIMWKLREFPANVEQELNETFAEYVRQI